MEWTGVMGKPNEMGFTTGHPGEVAFTFNRETVV